LLRVSDLRCSQNIDYHAKQWSVYKGTDNAVIISIAMKWAEEHQKILHA